MIRIYDSQPEKENLILTILLEFVEDSVGLDWEAQLTKDSAGHILNTVPNAAVIIAQAEKVLR